MPGSPESGDQAGCPDRRGVWARALLAGLVLAGVALLFCVVYGCLRVVFLAAWAVVDQRCSF